MGLANAITDTPSIRLKIDVLLEVMGSDDAEVLRTWLLDRSFSNQRISDAMTQNGTPVSPNTIRLWRRRNVAS